MNGVEHSFEVSHLMTLIVDNYVRNLTCSRQNSWKYTYFVKLIIRCSLYALWDHFMISTMPKIGRSNLLRYCQINKAKLQRACHVQDNILIKYRMLKINIKKIFCTPRRSPVVNYPLKLLWFQSIFRLFIT